MQARNAAFSETDFSRTIPRYLPCTRTTILICTTYVSGGVGVSLLGDEKVILQDQI